MMAEDRLYGNQIYHDYLFNFGEVSEFYEYDPNEEESFIKRSSYLRNNYQQDRDELSDILKKYNKKLNCSTETLNNIELLQKKDTGTVVTGQQAGVFTGPLYTIYKAITAILLAKKSSQIIDKEVVPIFWVASEDHDFAEINHLDLINTENDLETIELTGDYMATSIGEISIGKEVFELIDNLAEKTYDTEFKDKIINDLSRLAKDSNDLAEWFSRIMLKLFNDYGLIIFDPMWSEIRELSKGIYQQIIRNQSLLKQNFRQRNQKLDKAGYSLQINKDQTNSHLFVYLAGKRYSLLSIEGKFQTRNRQLVADQSEILEMINNQPESFSSNVVTRPIVQEYLLPTIAYVGGPGEIAYHGQLKELYSTFNLQMPILYPRESITIVENRIADYMKKYGIKKEDIFERRLEQKLEAELEAKEELDISQIFAEIKDKFTREYQSLIKQITNIDKNLEELGEQNLARIIGQVEYLEEKTEQFHKRNNKVLVRQFKKLSNNLFPKGKLQERVFNIFPYFIKYDYDLIDDLIEYFNLSFKHRLYYYRGDSDDS